MKKPKFFEYEYWSFWLFYSPFVFLWLWYVLKSRSWIYFANANPGIEFGGFIDYSKYHILKQFPQEYLPKTILLENETDALLKYPFVAKPDMGERGKNVEIIHNQNEWNQYYKSTGFPILIQDFMDEPLEFGVFYAKLPNSNSGEILSITSKEFLRFYGDGEKTLRQFISQNSRAKSRKVYLEQKFQDQLDLILPKGESILLEEIGNHNRGTKFMDASKLKTPQMEKTIDLVSQSVKGFYWGRYDIKAESIEAFQAGNFRIVELNGSNSEATHIYDPNFNLILAYKEVYRHLKQQYLIANQLKENGEMQHSFPLFRETLWNKLLG